MGHLVSIFCIIEQLCCSAWLVELDVCILVENGIGQSLSSFSVEERNEQVVEGKWVSYVDEAIYSNSIMDPHDFATKEY
jgi:hypothetical protein